MGVLSPAATSHPSTARQARAGAGAGSRETLTFTLTFPSAERVFDCLLAVSIASWGVLGLTASAAPIPIVRWVIALLHVSVAVGVARRSRLRQRASTRELVRSLPALVLAGLAFKLAAPLGEWPLHLEAVFTLGAALAVWSFAALGESFGILPARRGIVCRGPYRLVRHPAYAGEVLMILACALTYASPVGTVSMAATVLPLVGLRIRAEEELLSFSETYRRYRDRVRSRLIPFVW